MHHQGNSRVTLKANSNGDSDEDVIPDRGTGTWNRVAAPGHVDSAAMPPNLLANPGYLLSSALGARSGQSSPKPQTPARSPSRSPSPFSAAPSVSERSDGNGPFKVSLHSSARSNQTSSSSVGSKSGSLGRAAATTTTTTHPSLNAPSFAGLAADVDPVAAYMSASAFDRARLEEQLAKWTRTDRVAFFRAVSQRRAALDWQG